MQQITDGIINVNVSTNTPDLPVPNTGIGSIINTLGGTGCTILVTALVMLLLTATFFCLRSKLRNYRFSRFLPVLGTALIAFAVGFTAPAIASTVNAINVSNDNANANTVNLDITTKPNETTTATANTTINTGSIDRAHMLYAYVENNNMLYNTLNPSSIILATSPTHSTDPSSLTTNSYGIKTDTTDGFTSISTDPQHPTLLYTSDQATTGQDINLTYGVKLDDTITAGTYTNINNGTTNKIKYIAEPQHKFTLNFTSEATPSSMPTAQTYGPAATLDHTFTIPNDTSSIPTRSGSYAFMGWCNGTITSENTCDGTTYKPGDTITTSIDPATAVDVTTTLHAIWKHVEINYNENGGMDPPIPTTMPEGATLPYTFTVSGQGALTRAGYEFSHWNTKPDGTGDSYNPGDTITTDTTTTLYAIWEGVHRNITYKSYDGTTEYGTQEFVYGTSQTMRTHDATSGWTIRPEAPAGKTFVGWTKTQGSTTPDFTDGQAINALLDNTTVYAIWSQDLTLNFYQGDGTNNKIERTIYNAETSTTYDAPAVNDRLDVPPYTIIGWGTTNTATTAAINSAATGQVISQSNTGNSYYAVYSYPVTASYDANTGAGLTAPTTCTAHSTAKGVESGYNDIGCNLNLATNGFMKTGYNFWVWAEGSPTGDQYIEGAPRNLDFDTTYYAIWKANPYTISYNLNDGTAGEKAPTTATYDTDLEISNPTKDGYDFKGWTITGMDNVTHYYGDDTSSYNTTTASSLTDIKATHFKNLTGVKDSTITFTAVWETHTTTFDEAFAAAGKTKDPTTNFYKMQDMDTRVCSAIASPTSATAGDEQTTTLVDTRDNKTYTVGKLLDGKCWMTQNLALGSKDTTTTITPEDSNVTSNYTLPASSTDWTTTDLSVSRIYYDENSSVTSRDEVYYNFRAATAETADPAATSGDATGSICPKGWKLPTGGEDATVNQFAILADKYDNSSSPYYLINALKLNFVGYYDAQSKQVAASGFVTYLPTSTIRSASDISIMAVTEVIAFPDGQLARTHGAQIRCVADTSQPGSFEAAFQAAGKTKATAGDGKQYYKMQDMTSDICSAVAAPTSATSGDERTATLVDTRDSATYTVSKLADGNCWMTQNLALGGTSAVTLTSDDTNISTTTGSFTLPASGTDCFSGNSCTGTSGATGNGYTVPAINADSKDTVIAASGSSPAGKVGVYYNYCAASGGTYCPDYSPAGKDATEDICPKGWRMPTSGSSGEYQSLDTTYGSNVSSFQSALSTPLSGYIYGGTTYDQGTFGYLWSSSRDDSRYMYHLNFSSNSVHPTMSGNRYTGYSVRCIAR